MAKLRDIYLCVTASQARIIASEGLRTSAHLIGPNGGDLIVHAIVCGTDPVDVLFDAPSHEMVLLHFDASRIPQITTQATFDRDANPSHNTLACGLQPFIVPPEEIAFLEGYRFDPITALAA